MNVTVIRAGLHLTATFNIHNSLPVNTPHIIHNAKFTLHDFRPDLQVMELADRSGRDRRAIFMCELVSDALKSLVDASPIPHTPDKYLA